ncbi:MAG: prepilin-type N-terminal cleavage/methylation domain-containing protein [Phycisphaeraceae bacterium]|nr:prepilin-type N-terminal cleavage/methylation domain-containing protein [Phycisphaeraceae bacterium]
MGGASRARGFSLFEVLLAVALTAALSGAMYAFLDDLLYRRSQVLRALDDAQAGNAVIERIEADVMGSLAGSDSLGAGVSGDNTRLTVLTRGVTPPLQVAGVHLGDLQATELQFDGRTGELRGRRFDALAESDGGESDLISDRLERVRFRYHDGQRWVARFDSLRSGGLPVAIEVALWFRQREPEPEDPSPSGSMGAADSAESDELLSIEGPDGGPPEMNIPMREPDRVRVIAVPDAPEAGWEGP